MAQKWLHLLLLLLLISGAAMSQNFTNTLPGYPGELPFSLETGYVGVGHLEEVQLFYYFIESERNPVKDPLLLWLDGGPGCSAFSGLVYEIGPLTFDYAAFNGSLPTFLDNPYSWTQIANVIFVDAPVGTGFSYSTTQEGFYTDDYKYAEAAYQFLRKWLINHPKFSKNPLYIAGDSYSGLIAPQVALKISDANIDEVEPLMNLMGYVLGNPITNLHKDENSRMEYFHRLTLISSELYESIRESCNGEYITPNTSNADCVDDIGLVAECTIKVNDANILEPKFDQSWRKLTERQEEEIEWIRENISIVLRRSTVLLNRYSLHFSGLAPIPCPFLPQFRRYRRLSDDLSMVRERRDFYQLKKAVGDDPLPEAQLVAAETAGAPAEAAGAAIDAAGKRKKKKAKRVRATSEADVGEEDSGVPEAPEAEEAEVSAEVATVSLKRTAREEVREHRKKQKVSDPSLDGPVEGVGTALATRSTGSDAIFGREVESENAKLFLGCARKALLDPLPLSKLADLPAMTMKQQRDLLFHCKQKLAYEELMLDRRYWEELRSVGGQVENMKSGYNTMYKLKEEATAELVKVKEEAGRLVQEAEEKAKAAVASEVARIQADFDKRLEEAVGKAREEAVMAYRRDRQRAVEQATAYMEGGAYILGKIKDAFPAQDWSRLPVPTVTEDFVDDEHKSILQEIDEEAGTSGQPAQQQQQE